MDWLSAAYTSSPADHSLSEGLVFEDIAGWKGAPHTWSKTFCTIFGKLSVINQNGEECTVIEVCWQSAFVIHEWAQKASLLIHITLHSAWCCLWLLRDNFSRVFWTLLPPFFSSSRRSCAFGYLHAWFTDESAPCSRTSDRYGRNHSQAANSYHLLASSRLRGQPMPTSV